MGESRDGGSGLSATERANELLDRVTQAIGPLTSTISTSIARVVAYAREGAEDVWAEARNMTQESPTTESGRAQTDDAKELEAGGKAEEGSGEEIRSIVRESVRRSEEESSREGASRS